MSRKPNRRDFLKTSAAAGVGYWVAGTQSAHAASKMKNGKINVGSIGCGGQGEGNVHSIAKCGGNIVALCDVDWDMAQGAFKSFPNAKRFFDFREMFDKVGKELDAVSVSTPDHTHAVASSMAMKLGKHVYTQKPLTHDVFEARYLTELAAKTKLVTQMGNQGSAEHGLREAVEVIQSGHIGPVKEVHVWTNRPIWPQGARAILGLPRVQSAFGTGGDPNPMPPVNLKYDLWLGTAPERPFPGYNGKGKKWAGVMPFNWRGFCDYGTGALGDMACHTANMAFRACKLGYPTSVEAEVSEWNGITYPLWSVVRYDFPDRGEGYPPLKWNWYDGASEKPAWVNKKLSELTHGMKISDSGSLLIGEKMTIYSPNDYGAQYYLIPKDGDPIGPLPDASKFKPPEPTIARHPAEWLKEGYGHCHFMEWVNACEKNDPSLCYSRFAVAGPLTETVVLGCVAMRAGKRIEWNGPDMKIINDEKANQFLKREYRKGWEL